MQEREYIPALKHDGKSNLVHTGRMTRRHLFLIWVVLAASLSLALGAVLPAKLSDAEFWQLITDLSEEDGYFRFENFVSNELEYQSVIPALNEATKPGGVYLGVGPEQNFTYVSALKPKMAFIIDIRRQNMLELLMYKAVFEMSSNREDFMSRLFGRKRPSGLTDRATADELITAFEAAPQDPALFAKTKTAIRRRLVNDHRFRLSAKDLETIDFVYMVFFQYGPELDYAVGGGATGGATFAALIRSTDDKGKEHGFLASEANYKFVREMQQRNLIVPLVGDFAGPKTIRAIGQYLKERGAVATAFYLSNVEQYLFAQSDDWSKFYSNVAALPLDSTSQFIRTSRFAYPAGPRQLPREPQRGTFLSLLSPMEEFITLFNEGHIESYNQVIQMSK